MSKGDENILRVYEWKTDEYMLVDWYHTLVTSGDHYVIFTTDMRYLSVFLAFFKPPRTLAYALDHKGIWFAFWLDPIMGGAFIGLWVREDKRQAPSALKALETAMDESFKFATTLIANTKQESVASLLERIGATKGMVIPAIWDGADVYVYTLCKDQWDKRHGKRR